MSTRTIFHDNGIIGSANDPSDFRVSPSQEQADFDPNEIGAGDEFDGDFGELENQRNSVESLSFPLNNADPELNYYLKFNILKYHRKSRRQPAETNTISTIILPIPGNLQVSYNGNYNAQELGTLGNIVANVTSDLRDDFNASGARS